MFINLSYRKRGIVPRTHTKVKPTKNPFTIKPLLKELDKNNKENNRLIKIILAYSLIKIKVNPPALYSVLKPETSSDSPSEKSKGVRLVSANIVTNQIKHKGKKRKTFKKKKDKEIISLKLKVL